MDLANYATALASHLMPTGRGEGAAELFAAVLHELAKGCGVQKGVLAKSLGWTDDRLTALLRQEPCIEYDDEDNVVGYGITLRETAHAFEIDGRRLHTWCALDALMFPAMIGKAARVVSRCPATELPVSLLVTTDGVQFADPTSAVITLPVLDETSNIRSAFCCRVSFYASASVAHRSVRPGTEVLSLQDGFRLGRLVAELLTARTSAAAQL